VNDPNPGFDPDCSRHGGERPVGGEENVSEDPDPAEIPDEMWRALIAELESPHRDRSDEQIDRDALSAALAAAPASYLLRLMFSKEQMHAAWASLSGYPPKDDDEIETQLAVAKAFSAALEASDE
jgi:hypothetical protein